MPDEQNGYLDFYALARGVSRTQASIELEQLARVQAGSSAERRAVYDAIEGSACESLARQTRSLCLFDFERAHDHLREQARELLPQSGEEVDVLARYRTMLERPAFFECHPRDMNAPMPRWAGIAFVDKMALSQDLAHLYQGQSKLFVAHWLGRQQFWLRALQGAGMLLSFMLALEKVRRGLSLLHDVLQRFDLGPFRDQLDAVLQQSATLDRALAHALVGEFQMVIETFKAELHEWQLSARPRPRFYLRALVLNERDLSQSLAVRFSRAMALAEICPVDTLPQLPTTAHVNRRLLKLARLPAYLKGQLQGTYGFGFSPCRLKVDAAIRAANQARACLR
ncbi:hypothetical protein ACTSKR_10585 [Chitinibacteraceae bacterium HSL-7]